MGARVMPCHGPKAAIVSSERPISTCAVRLGAITSLTGQLDRHGIASHGLVLHWIFAAIQDSDLMVSRSFLLYGRKGPEGAEPGFPVPWTGGLGQRLDRDGELGIIKVAMILIHDDQRLFDVLSVLFQFRHALMYLFQEGSGLVLSLSELLVSTYFLTRFSSRKARCLPARDLKHERDGRLPALNLVSQQLNLLLIPHPSRALDELAVCRLLRLDL